MKNLFKSLVVGALLLGSVGCSDMFKEDLYEINNEIDKINQRIDSLCNAVNTNIASLQTIIDVMQDNDYVDSITPIVEGGETVGYEIVFTQSGSVKIYHGKKGETGHTPIVGVQQAEDGRWYWTIDGEWLLDGEGDKVLAEAIDGIDGEKGEEGITPKLEVRDNYWYISYDNGATWVQLGKATGENGKDGDSMFKSISYNEDYVELVLADGKTVIKIPTWASHMLLVDEIAKINSNISAIQAAVEALESNDYVQKVTPVKDEDGNVIGYTLQFAFTGDVTIFHGEDGKDGEDGEDGKDGVDGEDGKDGYTPVIGARQHPDGIWYWTVDGEWLLDTNGNRVKTTGDNGADGTIGITPELKIQDDYWYVSYDKGQTWTKLGKAKGEDGAAGSAGTAGDAFFKGVNVTEDYVTFTLADGTEIKIPTWKVYQELADAVAHLNTNVQSMQTIIAAIQNNDFVTGTTEIVDPQTNEVIGYTLHFSKSGDIEIYHGKTPNAPEIGIKKHPQYGLCWTYNGEYIKDPGTGAPVALPKDGASGVTPQFKIVDGFWFVSMDEGRTWQEAGQATGDQGETGATGGAGDSFFKSVKEEKVKDANGNDVVAYIVMTLADGSEYRVPTAYITDELTKRIAAIEGQFATISTIVGALQNAEYIKKVEPVYSGPALIGYDITFVKYTLQADGRLTEETWVSEIRNGGAGTNGTVVEVAYDEKTDTYYWTLDGTPIKDKDGNLIPVEGKDGKTPTVEINADGYWVINGANTGVKARGEDGNNGEDGSNASSLFSDVVLEGSYYVFYFTQTGREPIKVPSWKAFEDLQKGVSELEATVASFNAFLNGNQYIKSVTAIDGNRGWDIEVAYYNAETQQWENKHYNIYNGTNGDNGVTPEIPAITVEKDPTDNNYYWKVGGVWLTDDEGNRVRANGTDGADGNNGDPGANGLTPEFRINTETGELEYMFPGDKEWISLGKVVGKDGEDGNDGNNGANGATNIVFASAVQFDENGAYVSYTKENDANKAAWVGIQYGTGSSDFIWVPTYKSFQDLLETLNAVEGRVEAIEEFVNLHKTSIEGIANLSGNVTQLMQDVATLKTLRFIGTPVQTETGWEIPVYDGTGAEVIGEKITLTNGADGTIVTMVEGQDGEMYWKIGDTVTEYRVTGNDGKTPTFQINDITGQLEYKFPDTDWIPLGDVVGSDGTNGSNGATNIILASEVQFNEEGAYVSYSKVTDASQANWVGIIFSEGENAESNTDDQIIWVPTYKHFEALAARVTVVEGKVQEIEEVVALHTSSLEGLSALSGNVTELMADVAKLKTYKFIGTPVKTETGWEIPVVNGAGEPIEAETITLTNGADGADGTIVTMVEGQDGEMYWKIGDTVTKYRVTGNDGKTPIFQINENGVLEYKFEGDETWTKLDKVVGEPGAPGTPGTNGATNVIFASVVNEDGTFTKVEDAAQADWVGIIFAEGENADSYDDDQIIWVPTYKNFQEIQTLVTTLNTNVTSLSGLINGKRFITAIEDWSSEVNDVQTGFKITYVEISDNKASEPKTMYIYNGTTVGVKKWTVAENGDDKLYWTIDGEWLLDENGKKVLAVGKTPEFKIENDILYWKYTDDGDDKWNKLDKVKGDQGTSGLEVVPNKDGSVSIYHDKDGNGTIDKETELLTTVAKWIDASKVKIEFFNVSLDNLTNATTPITELTLNSEKTILYRVYGSASGTTMPNVMATCEGGYVLSYAQPTSLSDLGSVGQLTITPTYAFTSGGKNGRVIVFLDYYGTTIMKELVLKGTANVEIVETIEVEGSGGTVKIDLKADKIGLDFKNRPALGFSYNYNDFVNRTQKGEKEFVLAEKVGTGEKWISRGDHASAYDNLETLTISPNPTNRWRAGMVVVYPSKDSQVELAHIKIIQKPGETNLANPDKLGPDDPANCYIVSEPGRYLIPTYKGNDNTQTYDFSTIDTPISDGTGITISTPEKVVRDGKQYIMFDVNMSQTAGTSDVVKNNNSMIAVRDASGKVVWSWHLWLTSGAIEGTDFGPIGNETYNTNATMLNRNLGASAARNTGLYYKWGDKDPFFTPTGGSADYHGGTDSGSWVTADGSKALTDPCPPGYKVPSTAVWNPNQNQLTTFGTDYFTYEGSPLVLYPYSGYIDESKKHIGHRTSKIADQTHDGEIMGYYEFPTKGTNSVSSLHAPRRYKNVVFEIEMDMNSGLAHALDGYFIYGYNDAGLDNLIELLTSDKCKIVSCERQVGSLEKGVHYTESKYMYFFTQYNYTGAEPNWNGSWETLDSEWFSSGSGTAAIARPAELANLKTELKKYLEKNQSLASSEVYDQVISVDTTNGLQVRCVSIGSAVK